MRPLTAPLRTQAALLPGDPEAGCQSYEEVNPLSERACKHCGSGHLRRLNRRGWAQVRLLPLLGFYPWECTLCRCRMFWRDNGHRIHAEAVLNQQF